MCAMRGEVRFDRAREIALHDLHVIDVVLQEEVVRADFVDDVERLLRAREIEAGNVARVDRLDQEPDAGVLQLQRGELQVRDERRRAARPGRRRRAQRPARQFTCLQPSAVAYSIARPTPSWNSPTRSGWHGDAALALGPVAGRQVVQDLREPVLLQSCRRAAVFSYAIGKQVLDALEAGFRGGVEALEEIDLVVEHGEVGGELGHVVEVLACGVV